MSRYPAAALLRWLGRDESAASRRRQVQDDEQLLSRVLIQIAVTASGFAKHYPDSWPVSEQISALAWCVHGRSITHSWHKPAGFWARPDYNPGIAALASWARAVMMQRPGWPESADLVRLAQALSNTGHTT